MTVCVNLYEHVLIVIAVGSTTYMYIVHSSNRLLILVLHLVENYPVQYTAPSSATYPCMHVRMYTCTFTSTCTYMYVEVTWIQENYDHDRCKEWMEHARAIQAQVSVMTGSYSCALAPQRSDMMPNT